MTFTERTSATTGDQKVPVTHSPGPWSFKKEGGDFYIYDAAGVALFCDTDYYPRCSSNEYDWPLIAVAPEMLVALERAEQLAQICIDWNLDEVEIDGVMVATRDLRAEFHNVIAESLGPAHSVEGSPVVTSPSNEGAVVHE